ncbi:alpha/beta fold hydrolase [Nocardioides sp. MAH-18]|uniref:Alpha/beta fold hydrolase n=1 Tax=Nocardioides agri TaxID=2682843 RepID=A0A6L6XR68_9ACTN|nr:MULTISPECIES: alpha/beta fold hydrolase [unclassified Nocardioides]MBA2954955.1 alpha/beta fold hydrolase [Nocardioides sp. CGMCC 1.13656]MVQ49809.1 alpha/beta fold hydrolase [Nocardioides sp. MAH-18]
MRSPSTRVLLDPERRSYWDADEPRPIRVHEWPHAPGDPLVVLSHGTGGSAGAMAWLAEPLSDAGFRVVALDHHGNDAHGGYHPAGFLFGWERPRDLTVVLDALEREGPLGPVGAAGFSYGGYTVAALAGARLDPVVVGAVVGGAVPAPDIPEFPDVFERLRQEVSPDAVAAAVARSGADLSDDRVRAAFLVAPGLGGLVDPGSLRGVSVPVEIRWASADRINPFDADARPYLEGIPGAAGREVGPAGHEDFIPPLRPEAPVRREVAADAVAFFRQHLG